MTQSQIQFNYLHLDFIHINKIPLLTFKSIIYILNKYIQHHLEFQIPKSTAFLGGLKTAKTYSSLTSSKCLCVNFGVSPLSINKHLTPSEKFWLFEKCWARIKSCKKHSLKVLSFDNLIDLWVTWVENGHCSSRSLTTCLWKGFSLDLTVW